MPVTGVQTCALPISTCLILEGKAVVDHYGEKIPVEAGDLVTFPQGFHCQWEILEPLRVVGKATK